MKDVKHFGFDPKHYKLLIAGLLVNLIGFLLMIGGGSDDPNTFNESALFSPIRLTLAPFIIVAGYVIIFYSIMKKSSSSSEDDFKN